MIIYKITNILDGRIYIGQDSKNNPNYLGGGVYLKEAQKKHGRKNFKKEILETCDSIEELDERETYWISFYNSRDKTIGYNLADGGRGIEENIKDSIENRKKKSKKLKGRKQRKEHIERRVQSRKTNNKQITKETRERLRVSHLGHEIKEETKTKLRKTSTDNWKSPEYRKKIEEAKSKNNYTHSQETREKIRNAKKGKPFTEEHKKNISKYNWSCKKIICINDNKEFDKIIDAAFFYKISAQSIRRICAGLTKKGRGHNFNFKYIT